MALLWSLVHLRRGNDPLDWALLALAEAGNDDPTAAAAAWACAVSRLPADPGQRRTLAQKLRDYAERAPVRVAGIDQFLVEAH